MAKKKPLRYCTLYPSGNYEMKVAFSKYDSPDDILLSRVKFYKPSAHSIKRLSRLLDQRKHRVNIDSLAGLSVTYTFPRRIK